ncbi:hypothetical protein OSTOST_18689 [Ostertagia ostertagi]
MTKSSPLPSDGCKRRSRRVAFIFYERIWDNQTADVDSPTTLCHRPALPLYARGCTTPTLLSCDEALSASAQGGNEMLGNSDDGTSAAGLRVPRQDDLQSMVSQLLTRVNENNSDALQVRKQMFSRKFWKR